MESFITHTEKYKIKKTLIFTSDPLNVIKLYKKVMFSENGDILHLKLNKKNCLVEIQIKAKQQLVLAQCEHEKD